MNVWKPGQLVTIDGKIYRVKRSKSTLNRVLNQLIC